MYQTKIYGHRGASEYAPENTLEAFAMAYNMGADGIELDVQRTADGHLVVCHDESIDRVSNGRGLIKDMTLNELKSFDFNRTHPDWKNTRIPLLEEVLEWFADKEFLFNLELKNSIFPYEGLEIETLELVKKYGVLERTIFSSFNHASMVRLAQLEPRAKTAFLTSEVWGDVISYLETHHTKIYHPGGYLLNHLDVLGGMESAKDSIQRLHEAGITVNTWTINSGSQMRQLCNRGVDGIITNKPDLGSEIRDDILPA